MDKIEKFLKRLTHDEQHVLRGTIRQIHANNLNGLDVKKLRGFPGLFRVRKGNIRIIFQKEKYVTNIIAIDRRGEDTYKL